MSGASGSDEASWAGIAGAVACRIPRTSWASWTPGLLQPRPLQDPSWNSVVLGLAFVFEAIVLSIGLKQLLALKGEQGVWQSIRTSKDPTTFVVVFEDAHPEIEHIFIEARSLGTRGRSRDHARPGSG